MTGAPQLAFDFDGPANLTALERLIAEGEQPGVVARTRLLEAWVAAHGRRDMYRRATTALPWPAWKVGFTAPGGITSAAVLEDMRADGCVPTTLTADTRPHHPGCPVWTHRLPRQTRHHAGGLLGGWDLGTDSVQRSEGMSR